MKTKGPQSRKTYVNKVGKKQKNSRRQSIAVLSAMVFVSGLLIFGRSVKGFFITLAIEVGCMLGVFLLFTANRPKTKLQRGSGAKGKPSLTPAGSLGQKRRMNSGGGSGTPERYTRLAPKNFNWVINTREKKTELDKEGFKTGLEEKKESFFPYRSPFDPINPASGLTGEGQPADEAGEAPESMGETEEPNSVLEGCGEPEPGSPEDAAERCLRFVDIYEKPEEDFEEPVEAVEEPCKSGTELKEETPSGEENEAGMLPLVSLEDTSGTAGENADSREDLAEGALPHGESGDPADKEAHNGSVPKEREKWEYLMPPVELLKKPSHGNIEKLALEDPHSSAKKLIDTLASFGVGARVSNISRGPSVTRYEIQPNVGVKVSKIVGLADDIALNLAATGVRIEAPIPGKAAIGIEVPNREITSVSLREVIESEQFAGHPSKLAFAVGKDIAGNTIVADIAKMPHLLIAGATGSGKSVCISTLIVSILYKAAPSEVKLLMVDPKVVELGIYNGIPHLLVPVVTDPKKAAGALSWAVQEMTLRYKLFAENNVRDLAGYNSLLREAGDENTIPEIVIIIDELADLMMVAPGDVEDCICRLAQMARAAGMHLVIATQRPSVDVITGVIKANIPSRISFAVSSQIDSRTILDMSGAEKLVGRGDMLFSPIGEPKPIRVQGAFISDKEVEAVVSFIKSSIPAEYDEEIMEKIDKKTGQAPVEPKGDDELLTQAVDLVIELGQASTSLVQRKLKVGYSRAARILDQMEAWGIIGPPEGSKPRQVLITKQEWEELKA
ncbi:MAG: DNA translocase FtsK [Clostridiales bacterium]|jgi:S-DNA-T family DNA segregation ATPase FtsK/SpoIIIE|nr:DNA translocase FtsK [Eubacteriales bacterium]MDH7566750.1 DNA translocase FtsK [Clostridiales bacterium]